MLDRYPIRRKAVLAAVIGLVASIALQVGVGADVVDQWVAVAGHVLELLVVLGVVLTAESETTPVADPKDNDGTPMWKDSTVQAEFISPTRDDHGGLGS